MIVQVALSDQSNDVVAVAAPRIDHLWRGGPKRKSDLADIRARAAGSVHSPELPAKRYSISAPTREMLRFIRQLVGPHRGTDVHPPVRAGAPLIEQ